MSNSITPTYLYVKQHSITGLLYFGKTIRNPIEYNGSGTRWLRHIRKHGVEHVETLWISEPFTESERLSNDAIKFSKLNQIVESDDWANLMEETGFSGGKVANNHIKTFNSQPRDCRWKQSQSTNKKGKRTVSKRVSINGMVFDAIIDAAKYHEVTEHTIYNWIKKGTATKL